MLNFPTNLEVAKYLPHVCFFLRNKLIRQFGLSQIDSLIKKDAYLDFS